MLIKDCVLNPRRYTGDAAPPAALEDTSRYHNDGVHTAITYTRLVSGLIVPTFNGTTSLITVADNESLDLTHGFTFLVWAYNSDWNHAATNNDYFNKYDGGLRGYYMDVQANGTLRCLVSDNPTFAWGTMAGVPAAEWVLLTATWNPPTISVYVNAVIGTNGNQATMAVNANNLHLGKGRVGQTLYIKDYAVMNRMLNYPLTQAQIYAIYQNERGWFGV